MVLRSPWPSDGRPMALRWLSGLRWPSSLPELRRVVGGGPPATPYRPRGMRPLCYLARYRKQWADDAPAGGRAALRFMAAGWPERRRNVYRPPTGGQAWPGMVRYGQVWSGMARPGMTVARYGQRCREVGPVAERIGLYE